MSKIRRCLFFVMVFSISLFILGCNKTPEENLIAGRKNMNKGNKAKAVSYFTKAAEQGNTEAQLVLGSIYSSGSTDNELNESIKWYTEAANNGNAKAQYELGNIYTDRKVDTEKALEYFQKAVDQNHKDAFYSLALIYYNGVGVKRDYKQALVYFTQAANTENSKAQNTLGTMYASGQGTKKDLVAAFKWYQKAALNGNEEAAYTLGEAYYNGNSVAKDFTEAKKWYQIAAKKNHSEAITALKKMQDFEDKKYGKMISISQLKPNLPAGKYRVKGWLSYDRSGYGPMLDCIADSPKKCTLNDAVGGIRSGCYDKISLGISMGILSGKSASGEFVLEVAEKEWYHGSFIKYKYPNFTIVDFNPMVID